MKLYSAVNPLNWGISQPILTGGGTKICLMVLFGMYMSPETTLMTEFLKKNIDLARMKNPEKLHFSPF